MVRSWFVASPRAHSGHCLQQIEYAGRGPRRPSSHSHSDGNALLLVLEPVVAARAPSERRPSC